MGERCQTAVGPTDREQIWHTYAFSSWKGHELKKINPSIPEEHGGGGESEDLQLINLGKLPNYWTYGDQI